MTPKDTTIAGQTRPRLAAIDAVSGQPAAWNPSANNSVRTLLISGDTIYMGGEFDLVSGLPRRGFTALDRRTGSVLDWDPAGSSIANSCLALALAGNSLYAGGDFTLRNSLGQYRLAAFPDVGTPEITRPPENPRLAQGQSISLSVTATGQQPFAYQWRFNGTNVAGATNATFVISNAQATDSGSYLVMVANVLGAITAEAAVTVLVPVTITAHPVSQIVSPGSDIALSVSATGHPSPTYQWRLNGANIPGAVFATLILSNAQPRDGGSYSVIVGNSVGALSSDIARVVISSPPLPFADNFADRMSIPGASGVGSGSNVGATKEEWEPDHAGKVGGRSVWLSWTAPADGIALFNTRGSGFDTLLAIYMFTNQTEVVEVASDEDRGGFATSQAAFNAVAGTEYLIVIDGFAGASGDIVLSWGLDTTAFEFPRVIVQPLSRAVFTGDEVVFSVVVASPTPVSYQWVFNCIDIPGETNGMLIIEQARVVDVGTYRLRVMNASSFAAESADAFLEIGPQPSILSQDKLEDLLAGRSGGGGGFGGGSSSAGILLVSAGVISAQILNNHGATTSEGEPVHCGVVGGASKWFGLQPQLDGTLLVDTIGSSIDTVLAVYTGNGLLTLRLLDCDNDSAPDGIRSLLRVTVSRGTDYMVAVDGVNGAAGTITLNWGLGIGPMGSAMPTNYVLDRGQRVTLRASATNGIPAPIYQWHWNGIVLVGATRATLLLENIQAAQAGRYSVMASNFAGVFLEEVATITVSAPYLRFEPRLVNGALRVWLPGAEAPRAVLESSVDLHQWMPLYTITPSDGVRYIDFPATNGQTFFRALLDGE